MKKLIVCILLIPVSFTSFAKDIKITFKAKFQTSVIVPMVIFDYAKKGYTVKAIKLNNDGSITYTFTDYK